MKRLWLLAAFLAFLVMPVAAQQVPATANLTAQDSGACTTANACLSVNIPVNGASAVIQLSGTWTATVQFEASTGSGPNGSPFTAITGTPVGGSGAVSAATGNGAWRFNVASVYVIRARVSSYTSGTVATAITASAASSFSSTTFAPSTGTIGGGGAACSIPIFTDATDIGISNATDCGNIFQSTDPVAMPLGLFFCTNSASGTTNGLLVTRDSNGNCINLPNGQTTKIRGVVFSGGGTSGVSLICKIGSCPVTLDNTSAINDCIVAAATGAQGHDAGPTCPTGVQQIGLAQNVNGGTGTSTTADVFISDVDPTPSGPVQTIQVNGVTLPGTLDNFNSTLPAAPANFQNCLFQTDNGSPTSNVSLNCPDATAAQPGFVQLAQDLCGTDVAPIVCGIKQIPVTFTSPAAADVICFPTSSTLANCKQGVPIRTVASNSDTILSTDRVSDVRYTAASGATAVTLPQAGSAGFTNNITMVLTNAQGSGTVTVTPTTSTINGASTLAIPAGNYCFIYSDNSNYFANCGTSTGGSPGTVTSVAVTVPGGFSVSGSPVTTNGTFAITTTPAGADYVYISTAANTSAWEQVNGGSSCGDATHAVSYSTSTHQFGCQALSGSAAHPLVFSYGDPGNTVAIAAAATSTDYMTVPVACTINAWNLLIDGGTITVKFWKVATGTAIPTSANSINTSGVAISTGTAIHSTTLTDFTTTTVSANDIMAMNVTTNSGAKFVSATLGCQ
jgi:hypothetical protein